MAKSALGTLAEPASEYCSTVTSFLIPWSSGGSKDHCPSQVCTQALQFKTLGSESLLWTQLPSHSKQERDLYSYNELLLSLYQLKLEAGGEFARDVPPFNCLKVA